MGRIPLLLPLNVKPSEAAVEAPEPRPSISSVSARRATYANGVSGTSSSNGLLRAREARSTAASGSDVLCGSSADRGTARPDAGLLPGREPRPSFGRSQPSPLASTSAASTSSPTSPFLSSDGSTISRIASSSFRHAPTTGQLIVNIPGSASADASFGTSHDGSTPHPLRATVTYPLRAAAATAAPSPASDSAGAARSPAAAAATGGGAGGSAATLSSVPSGRMLALLAHSSCSTAEQQLRELLVDRASPGPASPGPASPAPPPAAAATAVAGTLSPHSATPAVPALPSFRRPTVAASPAAAVGVGASASAAAVASPPGHYYRHSPSLLQRLDSQRLALSACSSPITSPVPHHAGGDGDDGGGGGVVSGGALLAALLDHRQMLGPAHPSGARTERTTRFAAGAEAGAVAAGGGGGAASGGSDGEEHSEGEHRSKRRYSGGGGGGGSVCRAGGGRESPRPPHAAALVRQLREEQAAAAVAAAAAAATAVAAAAAEAEEDMQQSKAPTQELRKSTRSGVMWAALKPGGTHRSTADGEGPPQLHPQQQATGVAAGSAAAAALGAAIAPPAVTAAAMRAVAELRAMDEFSLVAAARHRQQQLTAQRTLSKRISSRRTLLVGGGGGGGGRSLQDPRLSLAEAPSATAAIIAALGGGGGGGHTHASLPHLLAMARTSCPEMGSGLDVALILNGAAGAAMRPAAAASSSGSADDAGGGSGGSHHVVSPRTSAFGGDGGAAAAAIAAAPSSPAGGGSSGSNGNGGSFLPAVTSPRGPVPSSSSRSLASSTYGAGPGGGGGGGGSGSRAGGSAPSTTQQHGSADFATAAAAAGPASEGEAARAAVRALSARFGSAVLPDAHPWDQDEHDPAVRERRKKLYEALQAANPAAYHEEVAAAAEAAYRALSERAQLRLRKLLAEPTTQEAPLRQLEDALRELTSQRPFFLPPVISRPKLERTFTETAGPAKRLWNVEDSIFAGRKKESESHDVYDTDKIRQQQLNLDWKRVVGKARFRRMVSKGDLGVKEDGQSLDEELAEVREELLRQGDFIRSAFVYYAMAASGATSFTSSDSFQMTASSWISFCHDAGLTGKGVTGMDVQNIFIAVNFEEESETEEAAANDDDAMVRFEFMEGLVRLAFTKYIMTKRMTDASDALGALLEEVVTSPSLPPEARVDTNEFRRTRLYSPEVEEVVREYWDLLNGMFKLYKARDRARYFWPEHFMAFLESNQLMGPATGLTRRDAKLLFAWSQATVTDELRRRQRAVSLTMWDFVEAVARLADFISPPEPEDMVQYFLIVQQKDPPEPDRLSYEYYRSLQAGGEGSLLRRPSGGLLGPPSRPLAPKLRALLQYCVCSLREAWGGNDAREVAAKVLRTANYLSGGIEMG